MDRRDRKYFTPIFMGAGDSSLADCYKLHKKLDNVFELLSYLQQPTHAESEAEAIADERKYKKNTQLLQEYVLQIISDLGFSPKELMDCPYYEKIISWNEFLDEELNTNKESD